jgi:hypothetical protein
VLLSFEAASVAEKIKQASYIEPLRLAAVFSTNSKSTHRLAVICVKLIYAGRLCKLSQTVCHSHVQTQPEKELIHEAIISKASYTMH